MSDQMDSLTRRLRRQLARLRAADRDRESITVLDSLPQAFLGTRLLARLCVREGHTGLSAWLTELLELLQWLENHPAVLPTGGKQAIVDLVAWQEMLIHRLDEGEDLSSAVSVEHLASLQVDLVPPKPATAAAQTGLGLDTVPGAGSDAGPDAEPDEGRREESLPPPLGVDHPVSSRPTRLLLLLARSLRAAELLAKLDEAGFAVELYTDPAAAYRRLGSSSSFAAVLCDNVEPTRHLPRLTALLSRQAGVTWPLLVLVSGATRPQMERYARSLGANGCWGAPYQLDALQTLLDGDSPSR